MSRALEALAAQRLAGHKPARVWVLFDVAVQPAFWLRAGAPIEIAVAAGDPFARWDWRPLVGCDVIVLGETLGEALRALVALLIEYVAILTLLLTERLPDEFGAVWERGLGWRRFGEVAHG